MENVFTNMSLNLSMFTGICKIGYFTINENGVRRDIQFFKQDILDLISGNVIEKSEYDKSYKFLLIHIDRVDLIETIKRSPIYMELANNL